MSEELRRIDGVGRVQLFGAEKAMRIWLDPVKLTQYHLTSGISVRPSALKTYRSPRAGLGMIPPFQASA